MGECPCLIGKRPFLICDSFNRLDMPMPEAMPTTKVRRRLCQREGGRWKRGGAQNLDKVILYYTKPLYYQKSSRVGVHQMDQVMTLVQLPSRADRSGRASQLATVWVSRCWMAAPHARVRWEARKSFEASL